MNTKREQLAAHLALVPRPTSTPATQTEQARRARGYGRLTVRVPLATLERLQQLAAELGHPQNRVINSLILLADQARPLDR